MYQKSHNVLLLLHILSIPISTFASRIEHDQRPLTGRVPFENTLSSIRSEVSTSHDSDWDYNGVTGPLGWTNLDPDDWRSCSTASSQSPVNIDDSMKPNYFNYKWNAPKSYCYNMTNDAHTIRMKACNPQPKEVTIDITASGDFDAKKDDEEWYSLDHIEFHSPSEHRFLGEYFPLEAQFVMKSSQNGKLRVRAILFDIAFPGKKPSNFFDGIYPHLPGIARKNSWVLARDVNTVDIMRTFQKLGLSGQVYNYKGSLTTPPCTTGVEWDILSDPQYMSVEAFLVFKAIMKYNSRYTQNKPGKENLLQVACHVEGIE